MSRLCMCGCGNKATDYKYKKREFISGHNRKFTTLNNPMYQGLRYVAGNGYVLVKCEDHPRTDQHGYVYEHILVAEVELGRRITRQDSIHHKNSNKTDNRPSNLMVFDSFSDHMKHHWAIRREARCQPA